VLSLGAQTTPSPSDYAAQVLNVQFLGPGQAFRPLLSGLDSLVARIRVDGKKPLRIIHRPLLSNFAFRTVIVIGNPEASEIWASG